MPDPSTTVSEPSQTQKSVRWQLALLVATFALPLLFVLSSVAKYHGDECFYTDAAIRMVQTGDYLTPYASNGALRFAKPILPYWAVVAGYQVFGINFFASRLFFLVAGSAVVVLTYRLSLSLFGRQSEALLAALIIASSVQLLTISIRSTPDAFLCLFVLASLLGFARVIFQEHAAWKDYALAYVGAGLAIQTRGLPGVGVLLFPWLFHLIVQRGRGQWRRLFEWKAVLLGLLVAASWFAVMLWLHGRVLIDGFYRDQVTENVRDYRYFDSLENLQAYLVGVLRHFLPWSALLVAGLIMERPGLVQFWREHRAKCWFLLGWFLFILAPFVFGGYYRTRYMIVAYPTLAVLLAGLLSRCRESELFQTAVARVATWVWVLIGLTGLALAAAGALLHPGIFGAGLLLLCVGGILWQALRYRQRWFLWTSIAAMSMVLFWTVELFLRPVFSRSPAPDLTARLLARDNPNRTIYALKVSPSYQAQMRVLSQGKLRVLYLSEEAWAQVRPGTNPVVYAESDKSLIPISIGGIEQIGFAGRRWRAKDFISLLEASKKKEIVQRNLIPYYVAFPGRGTKPQGEIKSTP